MSAARIPTPRRVAASRRVAYGVLRAVHADDAYANLLLPRRIADAGLSAADAGFATELTYGTLRAQGLLDRVIELAAGRPLRRIDPEVLDALRLGAQQLLGMRVAAHAAVAESVALVDVAGKRSATGFANAVLRAIARDEPEAWRARAVEGLDGDARLAVETSHPAWVIAVLRRALDAEGRRGELGELLAADNAPPRVALVGLPGLADPAGLGEPGRISPLAALSAGGDPAASPTVAAGTARVQDEGSQLAALALSRARPIAPGERWLDMCAGPGGKAALLGAEARLGGATLVANELVPARAGLVRRAVAVLGGAAGTSPVEVVEGDASRFGAEFGAWDRILLDAPCTGLGALRRRPEARWRKAADDVAALVGIQTTLLDAAVAALRPDGILAYVTCSPHPAETLDVIAAALGRHPELRALDTPAIVGAFATAPLDAPDRPALQLWPHRHGTDAMFIQLLTKVEG